MSAVVKEAIGRWKWCDWLSIGLCLVVVASYSFSGEWELAFLGAFILLLISILNLALSLLAMQSELIGSLLDDLEDTTAALEGKAA